MFRVQELKLVLYQQVHKYIQKEVYVPWKILKAMDLAPMGSLKYRGIAMPRQVEGLEKWKQGCLPANSTIQERAKRMYDAGQMVCPITHIDSELGEMCHFIIRERFD